jgi:lipopolysaccharide/colanic/teichoic acid biosynthesis glycosyltransferase
VRLVDGIPPIFTQERFGYGGKPFTILKLRTLPVDEKPSAANPTRIQQKPDYKTTRTGTFWRVHSIDEILQFWLVLKGDMSLVGHRPIPIYYIPHLAEMPEMSPEKAHHYTATVSQFKPSMTCLRSINGRANMSLQRKMQYDLEYADTATFWLDIQILLKTVVVVITKEGAK